MQTIKSTEHGNGIVAPYAHVTPNNVLGNTYDRARYSSITGINKLPPPPKFSSRRRADHTRIIVGIVAEAIFMTVVPLARVKGVVLQVLPDVGFEGPIVRGFQTGRRSRCSQWNDMIIDQVFVVARRLGIELSFRQLLSTVTWDGHLIPMETKIDYIKESRADRKVGPRRMIILRLENDQKRTIFRNGCPLFGARRASDVRGRVASYL